MPAEYDDIIVGAGSAGAVLAARLSEDPGRSVLLLEAGPDYPSVAQTPAHLLDSRAVNLEGHDWSFRAEVAPGRMAEYPRGKVTGGSSAVNATLALRGVPADYDEWAALGNDRWSWRHVLDWFCRLEDDQDQRGDLHGSSGPIPIRRARPEELQPTQRAFLDACKALGFPLVDDHNHPESTGIGPGPMNARDGVRISTAIAYLLPARHRLNLTIRPQCLARRILLDRGRAPEGTSARRGPRAIGAEVECGGEVQQVFGRRVTLSAGAVCSPAILLRSGIGPTEHLVAVGIEPSVDLPGVGENLLDHPQVGFNLEAKAGVLDEDSRMWQVILRYTAPGSGEFNDMQTYMFHWLPATTRLNAIVQRPRSRGQLRLTSTDAHVQPAISLRLAQDPEDLRRLREGARIAWRVAQSPEVAALHEPRVMLDDGLTLSPDAVERFFSLDDELDAYILRTVNHFVHPVGSARMGPDGDAGAVVDQHCQVRGVEGLRVADASVMPTIPRANTNLTCIMIGERVAGWMRAES